MGDWDLTAEKRRNKKASSRVESKEVGRLTPLVTGIHTLWFDCWGQKEGELSLWGNKCSPSAGKVINRDQRKLGVQNVQRGTGMGF